jgi:hypothetical protein
MINNYRQKRIFRDPGGSGPRGKVCAKALATSVSSKASTMDCTRFTEQRGVEKIVRLQSVGAIYLLCNCLATRETLGDRGRTKSREYPFHMASKKEQHQHCTHESM